MFFFVWFSSRCVKLGYFLYRVDLQDEDPPKCKRGEGVGFDAL